MRRSAKQFLSGLSVLFLALPLWAGNTKTYTAEWDASQATTIGNTQIKPGTYKVEAHPDQNTLDIVRDGKVIAQTPCHWIQLTQKASETEVETNHNQITQVEFAGKTEAVSVGSSTTSGN
ncbi:MAG TPA: hypothetical protein VHX49_16575 [Candidatus Acidoferrales bacterium]|jgi:hypothetical protein|nr:hypothetical protein [Candidatus Acidoferrales bacterium]